MTAQPLGPDAWRLAFEDTFDGDPLDPARWRNDRWGWHMNGVSVDRANAVVADGTLQLTLAGPTSGVSVQTVYGLPVGGVAEARLRFPGNGRQLYNWAGFWMSDWGGQARRGGENDVAEVLGGQVKSAYHAPDLDDNHGPHSTGYLGDEWHVWTLHRRASSADVYLDGELIKTWPTRDNGAPQPIILTVGATPHLELAMYGPPSRLFVDYVRAWEPV